MKIHSSHVQKYQKNIAYHMRQILIEIGHEDTISDYHNK